MLTNFNRVDFNLTNYCKQSKRLLNAICNDKNTIKYEECKLTYTRFEKRDTYLFFMSIDITTIYILYVFTTNICPGQVLTLKFRKNLAIW